MPPLHHWQGRLSFKNQVMSIQVKVWMNGKLGLKVLYVNEIGSICTCYMTSAGLAAHLHMTALAPPVCTQAWKGAR